MVEVDCNDPWVHQLWTHNKDLYCPYCGQHAVYVERENDYYVGQQHLCAACGELFYLLAGGYDVKRRDTALKVLKECYGKSDS